MQIPRWSRSFVCILISAGAFLQVSGNSGPKWSDQVETHLLLSTVGVPEKIDAKLYYDKEANKLAVLWREITPVRKLTEEKLLIYRFDEEAGMSINGHKCDAAPNIQRNSKSIQFLEAHEGRKTLKDFGSLLFFDPINHAKEVPFNWNESFPTETKKWKSYFVDTEDFGPQYCNITHYITATSPDSEEKQDGGFSILLKMEAVCSLEGPDPTAPTEVEYQVDILWSRNAVSDTTIFQQPPGVYCPFINTTRSFPSLSSYFSFDFVTLDSDQELINTAFVTSFHRRVWFDSSRKLVRKDNLNSDFDIDSTMIGDYNSRLSYIIKPSEECIINELKPSDTMEGGVALPGENFPLFPGSTAYSPQYVGQRKSYGITFDVWSNRNVNEESIEISDYYFTSDVHSEDVTKNISYPAFIELFLFTPDQKLLGGGLHLIGQFRTTPNIEEQSTFDVTSCFPETNKTRFLLTFAGDVGSINQIGLREELRKKLLSSLKVDGMRLGAMEVAFVNDSSIIFSSVIVEDPTRLGFSQGNATISKKEALEALSELVNHKLQISASLKDSPSKKTALTANKLVLAFPEESGEDGNDNGKTDDKKKKNSPGFSGGALAGVGIAMLVVGLMQGVILLVVYIKYRKDDPMVRKLTGSEVTPTQS